MLNEDECWSAVINRDPAFDGKFITCVKTTKIFCRPTCKARPPRRANVEFRKTPQEAQAAGYRACKRCQPLLPSYKPEADKIKKVCDMLNALPDSAPLPALETLAAQAALTKHHFHRLFKRETGLTPRQYALAARGKDAKTCCSSSSSESTSSSSAAMTPLTPFAHEFEIPMVMDEDAGMFAPSDFDLPLFGNEDAVFPGEFGGDGVVYYCFRRTVYGVLLVVFLGRQVCKLELGTDEAELMQRLEVFFPMAKFLHCPVELASWEDMAVFNAHVDAVSEALENPSGKLVDLPVAFTESTMGT